MRIRGNSLKLPPPVQSSRRPDNSLLLKSIDLLSALLKRGQSCRLLANQTSPVKRRVLFAATCVMSRPIEVVGHGQGMPTACAGVERHKRDTSTRQEQAGPRRWAVRRVEVPLQRATPSTAKCLMRRHQVPGSSLGSGSLPLGGQSDPSLPQTYRIVRQLRQRMSVTPCIKWI